MAKTDLYNNSLLPVVLVAGILSGSLWRATPPADGGRSGESAGAVEKAGVDSPPVPWVSDLRPAMDTIAAALGLDTTDLDVHSDRAYDVTLRKPGEARDRQILKAMRDLRTGLRTGLDFRRDTSRFTCSEADGQIERAAEVLGASFLADDGGNAKTRTDAANALLNEYRDWRRLVSLTTHARTSARPRYDVNFIVATVPDYVDSNSGWLADQNLAAIQSGMTRSEYIFDRVKLVDWSRSAAGSAVALSASRLHERQPGVMIFRRVHESAVHFQVVLLILETPTAGIHQTSLRNSLRFLRAWNTCSGLGTRTLRVLGPSFSGSTVSLASVLGESTTKEWFPKRLVITGSANADDNIKQMATFSDGAIYRATVQPKSVLMERMAAFLASMDPVWKDGERVALLTESNTAYGGGNRWQDSYLSKAAVFAFPMHVAQLRSDAPAFSQPGAALLPTAIVPLNMREPSPPTDLVPALRPQMTSPVVEATVDSILDTIRHEKLTAVGIIATDDRDVLFLAREVKRASPDVQLFLFGTHGLYLHPDYVPYLRGALVASSYSLSLANQPEFGDKSGRNRREPFQSMGAEGIFHATRALLLESANLEDVAAASGEMTVPYCGAGTPKRCIPVAPVSINVIGEDGYWTLPSRQSSVTLQTHGAEQTTGGKGRLPGVPPPQALNAYTLPPLPGRILIGTLLIGIFVLAHVLVLHLIRRELRKDCVSRSFLELPFVRVLAPPQTVKAAAGYHRFALTVCFVLLALTAAWAVAIALPFSLSSGVANFLVPCLSALTFGGIVVAAITLYGPSTPQADAQPARAVASTLDGSPAARTWASVCGFTGWLLFGGLIATMGLFASVTILLIREGTDGRESSLVLARVVGGGIVSPAALTVSLVAALYTVVITGIRRLSLVGRGYQELGENSRAFALLTGTAPVAKGNPAERSCLASMLDMPAQNLPAIYPLAVLLALTIAWIGAWHVSTIEGRWFSWFVRIGSLTALGLGLLLLAQGLATWNTARSHLKRLARSCVEPHFKEIASQVPWDISLAPPRLTELVPVARMADNLIHDFRALSLAPSYMRAARDVRRQLHDFLPFRSDAERRMGVREADMAELKPLFAAPSHLESLRIEMTTRQHAALIQSTSWFGLWRLSDAIVALMEDTHWRRAKIESIPVEIAEAALTGTGQASQAWRQARGERRPAWADRSETPIDESYTYGAGPDVPDCATRDGWFARCEQLVALQMAFVLRDIVARTITCLFGAMLCLTLLTAAHLFYSFNGRASMLSVDLLVVAGAALSAVWILVDMERDHVLSRLRSTTPGRLDINWDFIRRIAVYGVLPLLVVIASVFPEIGGTLFGWLEPLRKLSSF